MTLFEAIRVASATDDLDGACGAVQGALGQTDGGVAALFFIDVENEQWAATSVAERAAQMIAYVHIELVMEMSQ